MFPVIQLEAEHREDTESLGSKPKFWVRFEDELWLFKQARANTGEDWSEKVAGELALLLGLPCAQIELATFDQMPGCISKNFIDAARGQALVHGNEILSGQLTGYDMHKKLRQSDHTVGNIIQALQQLFHNDPAARESVLLNLATYLVFDALIANTDRHHENWGLKIEPIENAKLFAASAAPTFDHASSLGRELRDVTREKILMNKRVAHYIRAGRGGIYWHQTDSHGLSPLSLVEHAACKWPNYFAPALQSVSQLSEHAVRSIIHRIPNERASHVAKEFATQLVLQSQSELQVLT